MFKKVALAALVAAVAITTDAHAATVIQSFQVTATINPSCSLGSLQTYAFGTIGGTATRFDDLSPTPVVVTCSVGLPFSITLASLNAGGATGFQMINGAQAMAYQLYANNNTLPQWDASAAGTFTGTGTGAAININMYGSIPLQGAPSGGWNVGSFQDTVTMTVTY